MYKFVITFVFLLCFSPIVNVYAYNSFEYQPSQNLITQEIFSDYFNAVKSKLQKNWVVPDFLENGHTRIIFKLDREGYVLSARIAESSGNKLYDESALYALRNAEPFGKFPESATKEVLTINYSFDSELVKTKKMREYVELAEKMGIPVDKIKDIYKISQEPVSLETPIGEEDDSQLGDFISDEDAINPIEVLEENDLKERMKEQKEMNSSR